MGYGGKQANRSGDVRRFNFTGNGSNTAFDLGFTPATQNQLIVSVNGLVQHYDAFSISGSTLTFTGTPASGDTIQVTAVVDAVGVAAIPDGAVANVSTLTVSGAATLANTFAVTGNAVFSNTVAITGSLTTTSNTVTIGTAAYYASNGNLGINTSTPQDGIDVKDKNIRLTRTDTYTANVFFNMSHLSSNNYGTLYVAADHANSQFVVRTGGRATDDLVINKSGYVTLPQQPRFFAYYPSNTNSAQYQVFQYTIVNVGSCYNTSNGRFTVPVAGTYVFLWGGIAGANATVFRYYLFKNGTYAGGDSGYDQLRISNPNINGYTSSDRMMMITAAVGDYFQIYFTSDDNSNNASTPNYTKFSGWLLG